MFSRLSQYGWLISGGSISRAKMFYDIAKRTNGLVSKYDYVALDEISSIKFTDKMEMQGALKGYLESGDYHVGDYRGVGEAGMVLLGNISSAFVAEGDPLLFAGQRDNAVKKRKARAAVFVPGGAAQKQRFCALHRDLYF